MLKTEPHPSSPPEDGRYLRGNDNSPVAVAIILNTDLDKIPIGLELLVRVGVEAGAALSGTVQTENIEFEKMICNIAANTNIRYLILGGPEPASHSTGQALKALLSNGVDGKKRIIGTDSPHPFLYDLPMAFIDRFRSQLTLLDLQSEGDPIFIHKAAWSCYQEEPVSFRGYSQYDCGAIEAPPLSGRITWRVSQPWSEPANEKERQALDRARTWRN